MANEPEKKTDVTTAAAPVDKKGSELAALRQEVESLKSQLESLNAEKALSPTGDYAVVGGKTLRVIGTVKPKFATDEARKGNIDFEDDLLIVKS